MSTIYPPPLVSMIVTLLALCLTPLTHADSSVSVSVSRPLDSQLPAIARVNHFFAWSFSPNTFHSTDGDLNYTTSALPAWLAFDPASRSFSGTPSTDDEGFPEVIVTAHGVSSSASSRVTLCISRNSPPTVKLPITAQFRLDNPSLSSVFLPLAGSSLQGTNPTLRIPSKWSFSIGFEYETCESEEDTYYDVRLSDGSDLPDWMVFNPHQITLNGIVPSEKDLPTPSRFHLLLYASDQEGYSAIAMPFDIIIANHELSTTTSMPTINVTTTSPFSVNLNSPADFAGILVDSKPIHAQNISTLNIDVTGYDWLSYNSADRSLSGNPRPDLAGKRPTFPVKITTEFNQTIDTTVAIALVPSYFTQEDLPTVHVKPRDIVSFRLAQYFSNSSFETRGDVDLSVVYEPNDLENWLRLSSESFLEGVVPDDYPTAHALVTFTAYSHITHSTSHASLRVYVTAPENEKKAHRGPFAGLSKVQHARLVLALAVTFGVLGGLCLIGGILAIVRWAARVEDTALTGEEGRNAWSEKDRKWYGLDEGNPVDRKGPNWRPHPGRSGSRAQILSSGQPCDRHYGKIGLGLRRVYERNPRGSSSAQSSGVISKREFFARLKQTVRYVSDKYSPSRRRATMSDGSRSVIGKPVMMRANTVPPEMDVLPLEHMMDAYPANLFNGTLGSNLESTILSYSPSSSTAGHSIPQRRGDFGRLKPKTHVHFEEVQRVVRSASKPSARSNKGLTVFSQDSPLVEIMTDASLEPLSLAVVRPRLVPFTNSTRVPVPSLSPTTEAELSTTGDILASGRRIASQKARIMNIGQGRNIDGAPSGDELRMGLHYVQALGADVQVRDAASTGVQTNAQTSFSSLGSSNGGCIKSSLGGPVEKRVVVVPGTKFKFLVRIPPVSIIVRSQKQIAGNTTTPAVMSREYNVKIISGQPLSQLHVDLNGIETRGTAEIVGESTREDIGVISFGIYAGRNDEVCLAMVTIDVAETR